MTKTTKLKEDNPANQAAETHAVDTRSAEEAAIKDMATLVVTESDDENSPATTKDEAIAIKEQLEFHWNSWVGSHGSLLRLYKSEHHSVLRNDYKRVLEKYIKLKGALLSLIPVVQPEGAPGGHQYQEPKARTMKLPEIFLPKFSGEYKDWPQFRDLFNASVMNQDIADVQKMTILINHLKGPPADTISSIPISDKGLKDAWALLTKRYDDNKFLFRTFYDEATKFSCTVKNCGDTPRKLSDHIESFVKNATRINDGKAFPWNWLIIATFEKFLTAEARLNWDEEIQRLVAEEQKTDPSKTALDLKYTSFTDFLNRRGTLHDWTPAPSGSKKSNPAPGNNSKAKGRDKREVNHQSGTPKGPHCASCNVEGHWLNGCEKFRNMSIDDRRKWLRGSSVCHRCLKRGHKAEACSTKVTCRTCNGDHMTVMHQDKPTPSTTKEVITPSTSGTSGNVNYTRGSSLTTLFATAVVELQDSRGEWVKCRAFFDDGADVNCISQDCVKKLGLKTASSQISLRTVTSDAARTVSKRAIFRIRSRVDPSYVLDEDALIVKSQFSSLPKDFVAPGELDFINGLELADPGFHTPGNIDLLLGLKVYTACVLKEPHRGDGPIARASRFGWLLSGVITPGDPTPSTAHVNMTIAATAEDVLAKFWSTEEISTPGISNEEQELCVQHFHSTYKLENNIFTVRLPFNSLQSKLGESKDIAYKRFMSLEQKLEKSPEARKATNEFMAKYEELGHMSVVPVDEEDTPGAILLPHHAVIKMTSTTTKHRQVFDASARTSTGVALNHALMVGPTPQEDLYTCLLKFRCHKIAITGDIAMMYRQILVDPADRDYQRIFWRPTPGEPLRQYRLNTVTYGTACAPFLAIECLRELARLYATEHPLGSEAALHDFYVDDLVTGAATEEEAIALYEDITALLKKGNFELRKWASNSHTVLRCIPSELHDVDPTTDFESSSTRTLGIQWNHAEDCFKFDYTKIARSAPGTWTKRTMLSSIASLFDPLGLLCPVVAKMKMFIQELWKAKMDWDDPVPAALAKEFLQAFDQLPELVEISVPRCVLPGATAAFDLHGFCDASEKGYAACIYVVTYDHQGRIINSHLVTAKSKVAPVEKLTIPRLELNAAVLLVRLLKKLRGCLPQPHRAIYAWSDSTTVLHWIKSEIFRLKPYVHNRVKVITAEVPPGAWSYVNTKENPADCASRGILPSELPRHTLWWSGPSWLMEGTVPAEDLPEVEADEDYAVELKKTSSRDEHMAVNAHHVDEYSRRILDRPRRYTVMIRARALVERVLRKRSFKGCVSVFSVEELQAAEKCLIRAVQAEFFAPELRCLREKEPIDKKSHLAKLSPFVKFLPGDCFDDSADGIIRVGGRLANSELSYDSQHPVILPYKSQFSEALALYEHKRTLHGGPSMLQSVLGERFWILGARKLCRKVVGRCCLCFIVKARATEQLMADLPLARVREARPFTTTGVDYAGPVDVKDRRARGYKIIKGYIAVFVCFATKAIHLEFASDLSTEEFIAAFQRFVATRGLPAVMQSDNGTNFVGAANAFAAVIRSEEWTSHLAQHGVKWKTNTPGAPHHGGLWEAGVKSAKKHLVRSFHNYPMLPVEWFTALKRIEACLNSRPLLPLPSDADEVRALTPGHFLIGTALLSPPEYDLTHLATNRLDAWQRVMQRVQGFWDRWRKEYLSTLQQRPKWWIKRDFVVNAPVILKEPNKVTCRWDLGYIKEVYPGADGVVRSVLVKTLKGEYVRPVTKLCLLPFDGEGETAPGAAPSTAPGANDRPSEVVEGSSSTRGECSGQP